MLKHLACRRIPELIGEVCTIACHCSTPSVYNCTKVGSTFHASAEVMHIQTVAVNYIVGRDIEDQLHRVRGFMALPD